MRSLGGSGIVETSRTSRSSRLPVTAKDEDRARSREAGFTGHLAKSFDPLVLHKLVLAAPS